MNSIHRIIWININKTNHLTKKIIVMIKNMIVFNKMIQETIIFPTKNTLKEIIEILIIIDDNLL